MASRRLPLTLILTAALTACGSTPPRPVAEFARVEAAPRDRCDTARASDFEGAGAAELRRYARWLARTQGSAVALRPDRVEFAIAGGEPEPGPVGVTAGEVACADGNEAFRITLYREALVGRQLATAYQTVAHEFQHVVQIRRDGLPCGPRDGTLEAYEREAAAVAGRLVPPCQTRKRGSDSNF
jgi:hypothetical protein